MSDRIWAALLFMVCGTLLVIFGGLDVDNAWGAIGAFLAGVGFGQVRPASE